MKKGNPIALLPIAVFLLLYLGLGIVFEYGAFTEQRANALFYSFKT